MTDSLNRIIIDVRSTKAASVDATALRALLESLPGRLKKLKGVPKLPLGKGGTAGIMFADAVCGSPLPRFGDDCEVMANTSIGLDDVADALGRICGHVDQIADLDEFLADLIGLLEAFQGASPAT